MARLNVDVEGMLSPDGTLTLNEKIDLPPGRVSLSVRSREPRPRRTPEEAAQALAAFEAFIERQKARLRLPTDNAERARLRTEAEERLRQFERDQLEAEVELPSSLNGGE